MGVVDKILQMSSTSQLYLDEWHVKTQPILLRPVNSASISVRSCSTQVIHHFASKEAL